MKLALRGDYAHSAWLVCGTLQGHQAGSTSAGRRIYMLGEVNVLQHVTAHYMRGCLT